MSDTTTPIGLLSGICMHVHDYTFKEIVDSNDTR